MNIYRLIIGVVCLLIVAAVITVFVRGNQTPDNLPERIRGVLEISEDGTSAKPGIEATDEDLAHLKALPKLRELNFRFPAPVTDAGMAHLKELTQLQKLYLWDGSQLTDAGMANLAGMTRMQSLILSNGTQITDNGLAHLKGMTRLQVLALMGCGQITDAGLEHLAGLKQLRKLSFANSQITDDGVRKLQATLPKCEIKSVSVHGDE